MSDSPTPPVPPFVLTRETTIRIDKDGRFWHDGEPVLHPALQRALASWVGVDSESGRYKLENTVNWCFIAVDDAPLVVTSAARDAKTGAITLALTDGAQESLDLASLRLDEADILYCDVRGATLPARFSRHAAFVVLEDVQAKPDGALSLTVGGRPWPLRRVPVGQGAARR